MPKVFENWHGRTNDVIFFYDKDKLDKLPIHISSKSIIQKYIVVLSIREFLWKNDWQYWNVQSSSKKT